MSLDDLNLWPDILRDALARAGDDLSQPILGARFRQLVDQSAAAHGVRFPPDAEPTLRLSELLQRYPSVVLSLARPGQDMLIVPAGRPELLTETRQSEEMVGLRPDIFNAFTRINPIRKPWYDSDQDSVAWVAEPGADGLIPIPSPTLEDEILVRRSFVESLEDERPKALLLGSLATARPLQAFSAIIRAEQLHRRWHEFRTQALVDRIQSWAHQFSLNWNEKWLTSGSIAKQNSLLDAPRASRLAQPTEVALSADSVAILSRLEPSDLARIMVPLDVVLKLLR